MTKVVVMACVCEHDTTLNSSAEQCILDFCAILDIPHVNLCAHEYNIKLTGLFLCSGVQDGAAFPQRPAGSGDDPSAGFKYSVRKA